MACRLWYFCQGQLSLWTGEVCDGRALTALPRPQALIAVLSCSCSGSPLWGRGNLDTLSLSLCLVSTSWFLCLCACHRAASSLL